MSGEIVWQRCRRTGRLIVTYEQDVVSRRRPRARDRDASLRGRSSRGATVTLYATVPCPGCQRTLRVRREYGGKVLICRYCQHAFRPKIPVECPACRQALQVRLNYLGHRITCKSCGHTFRAPNPADAGAPDDGPEASPVAQAGRGEVAVLEEQAQRLREDLTARVAQHEDAVRRLAEAGQEIARLRAEAVELRAHLEQAHIDLDQASSLREELDVALNSSRHLGERTRELQERTLEVERLRDQLAERQAEFQQFVQAARDTEAALRRDLDAARKERDEALARARETSAPAPAASPTSPAPPAGSAAPRSSLAPA